MRTSALPFKMPLVPNLHCLCQRQVLCQLCLLFCVCQFVFNLLRKVEIRRSFNIEIFILCKINKHEVQVPFELLVRRQIARLLDPSLQCARFIYDELIKVCAPQCIFLLNQVSLLLFVDSDLIVFQMSHCCMVNELQRFPVLRRRMDEVIGNFLREGLEPSETMIGHIVEMEVR